MYFLLFSVFPSRIFCVFLHRKKFCHSLSVILNCHFLAIEITNHRLALKYATIPPILYIAVPQQYNLIFVFSAIPSSRKSIAFTL